MVDQLPLAGKSILLIEDEPLVALNVENSLKDAGAAVIKTVGSVAKAQVALGDGVFFDTAIVDLRLSDGDGSQLIGVLTGRGIPVVVTTGANLDDVQPDLSKAVAVLQKPYLESDLIKTMTWLTKATDQSVFLNLESGAFMSNDEHEQIKTLAHQIWEKEGRPNGQDQLHWEQAVREWEAIKANTSSLPSKSAEATLDKTSPAPAKGAK